MIEMYSGLRVWEQLEPHLVGGERREAAIAYVGADANKWLRLERDDVLIFDGDGSSIKQNHVDLDLVEKLMKKGVRLFSRPGLHAKTMVIEGDTPIAIVGSANASITSVTKKAEAVVVTNDPSTVAAVRIAMAGWRLGVEELDAEWLERVRKLPRKKQEREESTFEAVPVRITDVTKPLWLLYYGWDLVPWEPEVDDAVTQAAMDLGVRVEAFPLRRWSKFFDAIKVDDSILSLPVPTNGRLPRANSRVGEPGRIVDKLPRPSGRGGDILIGYRYSGETRPWREVRAAMEAAASDIGADLLSDRGRDAVFELFG